MLQLPLVPAYALTVHKTQALSIKHLVLGCVALSCTRASLRSHSVKEGAEEGWSCKRDGHTVCCLCCWRGWVNERERVL